MTAVRQRVRRALPALTTAVVIAAAAFLWHNLPTPNDVYAPIDVHAVPGAQASGRDITATVDGVRIAPQVQKVLAPGRPLDAVGMWVAVDAQVMTTLTTQVPTVELVIGPDHYVPTERLLAGQLNVALTPGIAQRGSWIFDVPADLTAAGPREMTLRIWVGDGRLDSRLVIPLRFDDARVVREDLIALRTPIEYVP
ncbi:MAG: hypothetical protein ACSLFA_21205 [Mycobacterium sp.]